ncbi:hypothetical protein F2P81_004299 [Scophthalmus maximus]|uniref:Uncharacterized protein n=1 Tax=Scophthalmus maximus TaxID=52904 RepID=A0A6A4TLT8_SCOMX|nr:hypothetical protein F2P81_004299 [Scophthalmus maximus]
MAVHQTRRSRRASQQHRVKCPEKARVVPEGKLQSFIDVDFDSHKRGKGKKQQALIVRHIYSGNVDDGAKLFPRNN